MRGGGVNLPVPQASGQILEDDVNGFPSISTIFSVHSLSEISRFSEYWISAGRSACSVPDV
jgi:hypothetical protein